MTYKEWSDVMVHSDVQPSMISSQYCRMKNCKNSVICAPS